MTTNSVSFAPRRSERLREQREQRQQQDNANNQIQPMNVTITSVNLIVNRNPPINNNPLDNTESINGGNSFETTAYELPEQNPIEVIDLDAKAEAKLSLFEAAESANYYILRSQVESFDVIARLKNSAKAKYRRTRDVARVLETSLYGATISNLETILFQLDCTDDREMFAQLLVLLECVCDEPIILEYEHAPDAVVDYLWRNTRDREKLLAVLIAGAHAIGSLILGVVSKPRTRALCLSFAQVNESLNAACVLWQMLSDCLKVLVIQPENNGSFRITQTAHEVLAIYEENAASEAPKDRFFVNMSHDSGGLSNSVSEKARKKAFDKFSYHCQTVAPLSFYNPPPFDGSPIECLMACKFLSLDAPQITKEMSKSMLLAQKELALNQNNEGAFALLQMIPELDQHMFLVWLNLSYVFAHLAIGVPNEEWKDYDNIALLAHIHTVRTCVMEDSFNEHSVLPYPLDFVDISFADLHAVSLVELNEMRTICNRGDLEIEEQRYRFSKQMARWFPRSKIWAPRVHFFPASTHFTTLENAWKIS